MTTVYNRLKHPTLRRGARGDAVMRLQRGLVRKLDGLDAETFADGIFGPGTATQVKRFQKAAGLEQDGVVGRKTWIALLRTGLEGGAGSKPATSADSTGPAETPEGSSGQAARLKQAVEAKGYQWFDDGEPFALNIIGVRSASDSIDAFDDMLYVVYRDHASQQNVFKAKITTDPGRYYTQIKLLNPDGAAILVPGQYLRTYAIGLHRRKYEALVQRAEVSVWRDKDMDDRLDPDGQIYEGWFGINIHRARSQGRTPTIGRYSAGCQVFQDASEFAAFMALARQSYARRQEKFTYTLLTAADF